MLDQVQNFNPLFFAGLLAASLAGSLHCVGMCGGLVLTATHGGQRGFQTLYHLSRLCGYLALGASAGFLGHYVLSGRLSETLSWIATAVIAFVFLGSAYQTLKGRSGLPVPSLFSSLGGYLLPQALRRSSPRLRPISVGFFSVLLPCGWLYSFVLTAAATQSVLKGTCILLVFWMGTLPALALGSWALQQTLQAYRPSVQKLLALSFVAMGIWSVWMKIENRPTEPGAPLTCHHHRPLK